MMSRSNLFSLKGKVALVTGGARGIGRFLATGLAEAGAELILTSRQGASLEQAASELQEEFGVKVSHFPCDLGDPVSINTMFKAVTAEQPKIDILVNNAGVAEFCPTLDYTQQMWDNTFNVNVRGVWLLTQAWAKQMKADGGNVINVSSIMGFRGSGEEHNVIAYNPSKAAVISMTQTLAVKLAPYNIRVNGIAPGYFPTDMMGFLEGESMAPFKQAVISQIPLQRAGEMDDMRGVIVFLASEASRFMTGHTLVVDGGRTAY
jgi:gluconate 5-dehydrogenase